MAANKQVQGIKSGPSSASSSRAGSPTPLSPVKTTPGGLRGGKTLPAVSSPVKKSIDQGIIDIAGLNLDIDEQQQEDDEPPPKMSIAREKVLEEALRRLEAEKKCVSLVVIGMFFCYLYSWS